MSESVDLVIIKLDHARQALIEAKTIQEAKQIVDIGRAMEIYARRQKLGKEAEQYANVIVLEAMRRVGKMLQQTDGSVLGNINKYQTVSNRNRLRFRQLSQKSA
jgi:CO dehydrogenase nickel-insertion accessory protein CooC1